ncbi:hypothetical protein CRYUN_Cryun10bG0069600 [Craigia yunnanensis]
MEKIQHSHVEVRGLKLHVAEIGTAHNVVLFLHGFPEIWYSWRHQMIAVANAGYRAIAIDFRGYRLSDQPSEPEKANFNDLVDDVVALLDSLGISKVFLVGKDFGAVPAFLLAVVHPDRVSGVITLGIPFLIPSPDGVQFDLLPKGFYVLRWAEPGRAEADFGRFDVKTVVLSIGLWYNQSKSHSSIIADHGGEGLFYEIPGDGGLHEERDSEAVYAQSGHHIYARRKSLCPRAASRAGE